MAADQFDFQEFEGFHNPTTTPVPDLLLDHIMQDLTESELKILLYITRRTFGFKKSADNISLKQLVQGIVTKDGRQLDRGSGLTKSTVARALKSLAGKGLITAQRRSDHKRGNLPTTYALRMRGNPSASSRTPPSATDGTRGVPPMGQGLSHGRDTQQTVRQQTGLDAPSADLSKNRKENDRQTQPATAFDGSTSGDSGADSSQASTPSNGSDDYDDPARQAIGGLVADFARLLGDGAAVQSSATRAYRIYQRSGLDLDAFIEGMYAARTITQERTAGITTEGHDPNYDSQRKIKMPYFFKVLEERVADG